VSAETQSLRDSIYKLEQVVESLVRRVDELESRAMWGHA